VYCLSPGVDDFRDTFPGLSRNSEEENLDLREEVDSASKFEQIVGSSPAIFRVALSSSELLPPTR